MGDRYEIRTISIYKHSDEVIILSGLIELLKAYKAEIKDIIQYVCVEPFSNEEYLYCCIIVRIPRMKWPRFKHNLFNYREQIAHGCEIRLHD